MSSKTYFIALGMFAILASMSAVALGRHHRPFRTGHSVHHDSHAAPNGGRALELPAGTPVETV